MNLGLCLVRNKYKSQKSAFSTGHVWSNCQYPNCNLLEHEWIRTGIRTPEAQIDEKNKNIEGRQNVTGSYKKKRVQWFYFHFQEQSVKVAVKMSFSLHFMKSDLYREGFYEIFPKMQNTFF